MTHNHFERAFFAEHLPVVQAENDMRHHRDFVFFQPRKRVFEIFGVGIEMIDLADRVTVTDDVDHRAVDIRFAESGAGLFIGQAHMHADSHAQFLADALDVFDVREQRHASLWVTAAGDQHAARSVLRKGFAQVIQRAVETPQVGHAAQNFRVAMLALQRAGRACDADRDEFLHLGFVVMLVGLVAAKTGRVKDHLCGEVLLPDRLTLCGNLRRAQNGHAMLRRDLLRVGLPPLQHSRPLSSRSRGWLQAAVR